MYKEKDYDAEHNDWFWAEREKWEKIASHALYLISNEQKILEKGKNISYEK